MINLSTEMRPVISLIKNPKLTAQSLLRYVGVFLPDSLYLRWMFRLKMGRKLNLRKPTTFSEKLQWLKLYDRKPEYSKMVDKFAVKDYVAKQIGKEYVIPTLGMWESVDDIEWNKLPDQFVLKTTHDGGGCGVVICDNKDTFDEKQAIIKLKKSLSSDTFKGGREWPYKNVSKRIIAEKYMVVQHSDKKDLPDYKFFCFDGKVKALFVATDRQIPNEDVKFDFFDSNYNHLPFQQGHENSVSMPKKPASFDEMKQLASKLSKGLPQIRVDFYEVAGKPYFGELTFYHFSGMVPFNPQKWDYVFGEWIHLPKMSKKI